MYVPKGNMLIEEEMLPLTDITDMFENLETDSFTGYAKLTLESSSGYLFFLNGSMARALEIEDGSGLANVHLVDRFLSRLKLPELAISLYVTSPRIVNVLSGVFAFQPLYLDYEVKRRELKKVLDNLEQGKYSGIIKMSNREGTNYLMLDTGELILDRFTRDYGQMLCGAEAVKELLDNSYENGATISVYAEKAEEIDNRRRAKEEELEKIKSLMAKTEGGFLRANDVVKIDEYVVREWGMDPKVVFNVEIEAPDGSLYVYKCQAARKMSSYAGLAPAMMKRMNTQDGDMLSIRPM